MARIERFEDIAAWQEARALVKTVYGTTSQGAFARDYGLRDQIQRAAVSIMSNIAEGFERESSREFIRYLYVAKGSAGELRSQTYIAFDLGYIDETTSQTLMRSVTEVSRLLAGFIKYLQTRPAKP